MKILIFLTFFCLAQSLAAAMPQIYDSVIEDLINQKLEEFRVKMRTGDPEMGMPVLAPFQADKLPHSFRFGPIVS